MVYESAEMPNKSPSEYTNEELEEQSYTLYKKAREENEEKRSPYVTAVVTRSKYDELNGTFVIGRPENTLFFKTPTYTNGELFAGSKYFYFIRAFVSEVRCVVLLLTLLLPEQSGAVKVHDKYPMCKMLLFMANKIIQYIIILRFRDVNR